MKLWICSGLLVLLLAPSGCSQQSEPPDYDALRSKLAVQLEPIEGWSAVEMEHSPIELEGLRIARIHRLVWRSYKSQETGEEVWLTVDAGHRRHLFRHLPVSSGCETEKKPRRLFAFADLPPVETDKVAPLVFPQYGEFEFVSYESDSGQSYTFRRGEEILPSPRWIHWAKALGGEWFGTGPFPRDSVSPAKYGYSVVVEVVSPPGWPVGHVSSDAKRLIANLMDQISPVVLDPETMPVAEVD